MWTRLSIFIVLVILHMQAACDEGPELYFHFFEGHPVNILENSNISVSFWLDTSSCIDPSIDYRLEIQTRRSDGTYEYDGRLVRMNNTCLVTYQNTVHCTAHNCRAELNKTVNRSHEEIVWRWSWMDDDSLMRTRQIAVKLKINYVNNDTRLNTYGNETTTVAVIEEKGQEYVADDLNSEEWATILVAEVVTGTSIIFFIVTLIRRCNRVRVQTKEDVTDKKVQAGEEGVVDRNEKEILGIAFDLQKFEDHTYIKQVMQWTAALVIKSKQLLRWKPSQETNKLHHNLVLNHLQDDSLCSLIPQTRLTSVRSVQVTFDV